MSALVVNKTVALLTPFLNCRNKCWIRIENAVVSRVDPSSIAHIVCPSGRLAAGSGDDKGAIEASILAERTHRFAQSALEATMGNELSFSRTDLGQRFPTPSQRTPSAWNDTVFKGRSRGADGGVNPNAFFRLSGFTCRSDANDGRNSAEPAKSCS